MDFLIAALAFLLVLLYHIAHQKQRYTIQAQVYRVFFLITTADIIFDMISSALIEMQNPELTWLTVIVNTIFYFLQVLMPCGFLCYIQSLRIRSEKHLFRNICIWVTLSAVFSVLIIANLFTGILFSFDTAGTYVKGPLYMWMYYNAGFYTLIALSESLLHFRELGLWKAGVVWEFVFLMGGCVVLQSIYNEILLTGFGLGLGLMVLTLTINNPYNTVDVLTNTYNKVYFGEWVNEQIFRKKHLFLISVDLKQMERVNKLFGNPVGDKLLIYCAKILKEFGKTDQIFRISGKRFVVALKEEKLYRNELEQLLKYFSQPIQIENQDMEFPVVIYGIPDICRFDTGDRIQAFLDYLEKSTLENSRTVVLEASNTILDEFAYRHEVEIYLHTAIENNLFEMYYQPIYSTDTKSFVTLEALSRLEHPKLGRISPNLFIQIAEQRGLMPTIGSLQFERVCRFAEENPELQKKIKTIKFNLSPAELMFPGHVQNLVDRISLHNLPYTFFQFEITETVATEYIQAVQEAVAVFEHYGIRLCLDDFGSGYANLSSVLKLPFFMIKMDRSLLLGAAEDEQISMFYRNMVTMLKNLGYLVVSEGVENEKDVKYLETCRVDLMQGFYFSRPVNENDILELLEKQK